MLQLAAMTTNMRLGWKCKLQMKKFYWIGLWKSEAIKGEPFRN
jgi:hypothetical protein